MSPVQVARLAREWFRCNGADPVETVKKTAWQYCYTPEQTATALGELYKLLPQLARPADCQAAEAPRQCAACD